MAKDATSAAVRRASVSSAHQSTTTTTTDGALLPSPPPPPPPSLRLRLVNQHVSPRLRKLKKALFNYAKFVGPGFMIAVAYST
jgi:hypothetical protein